MDKKIEVASDTPSRYWRTSYPVMSVRITEGNIREIAEHLGLDYNDKPNQFGPDKTTPVPNISAPKKGYGFVGDWVVVYDNDDFRFFTAAAFAEKFHKHSEQLSKDDQYAKIHQLVMNALHIQDAATYHGDNTGMDLVAEQTTKKILEQL